MIDAEVKAAALAADAKGVRVALTAVAFRDRGFHTNEFDESLAFASNVKGLWNEFDGEAEKPEAEWDEKYWNHLNASLMGNFCRERIDLLKKVGKKVYPRSADAGKSSKTHHPRRVQTSGQKKSMNPNGIPTGVVIVGAIAAIVGSIIGIAKLLDCETSDAVKGVAAIAAIAGGVALWNKRK